MDRDLLDLNAACGSFLACFSSDAMAMAVVKRPKRPGQDRIDPKTLRQTERVDDRLNFGFARPKGWKPKSRRRRRQPKRQNVIVLE